MQSWRSPSPTRRRARCARASSDMLGHARAACGSAPSTAWRIACCACTGRRPACRRISRFSTATTSCGWSSASARVAGLDEERAGRRGRRSGGSTRRRTRAAGRAHRAQGDRPPEHDAEIYPPTKPPASAPAGRFRRTAAARARAVANTPALLAALPTASGHMLVDEFQDTNTHPVRLAALLAGDTGQVTSWSATTTSRSTAGAAPRSRTSSASCATYPGASRPPGAELPLHRQYPQCRQRVIAHNRPPRQAAVDRRRAKASRSRSTPPSTRGRGALRRRPHLSAGSRGRRRAPSAPSSIAPTPSRGCSKRR
jgi:hypothetical protein